MGWLPFVFVAIWCMNLLVFEMQVFQHPFSFALKLDVQKLHFIKIAIFYKNTWQRAFLKNVRVCVGAFVFFVCVCGFVFYVLGFCLNDQCFVILVS